jgi:pimeloyl-ACP methyl ester carboxylesterase
MLLDVPGARLHFAVRGTGPLLVLVGAPMGTRHFAPAAELLAADHTVLTSDPRGTGASTRDDPGADSTPEQRADDVARLVAHLDRGPAAVFGTSGGAVTALALAQAHPERVTTVVAHEPPLDAFLPDRAAARARADAMLATFRGGDVVGAWQQFFAEARIALPPEVAHAVFGGERDPQEVADERHWFLHEMRPTVRWDPDHDRLRALGDRLVVAVGADSAGQYCDTTGRALAARLGAAPVVFPGGHTGFLDDPAPFAARLREVLG